MVLARERAQDGNAVAQTAGHRCAAVGQRPRTGRSHRHRTRESATAFVRYHDHAADATASHTTATSAAATACHDAGSDWPDPVARRPDAAAAERRATTAHGAAHGTRFLINFTQYSARFVAARVLPAHQLGPPAWSKAAGVC